MSIFLNCNILCLIFALSLPTRAQDLDSTPFKCSQPAAERLALIREAETNEYIVRRVEFIGNKYTRDAVLRRRIAELLEEGAVFTHEGLVKSLQNVSKLKIIYPVRLRDVVVGLDRSDKFVDMTICFRETRQASMTLKR